jgi:hypothetical protein
MRSPRGHMGVVAAACCMAFAALCLVAGPATAATNVYPAGGGTFTGGAQGWEAIDASCNVPTLCTASGGYDGSDGNPPGSLAANTTIGLNLLTLFKSTVTLQSPDFTVADAGDATLHLDRQFVSGSLVDLAPQVTYDVTLLDRTAGTKSEVLTETMPAASEFIGKDHAASVKAGHTYALSITAETSSTVAGSGLLGGTTSTRFDNVALSVETSSAGGGGSGGNGSGSGSGGSLSSQQLQSLIASSLVGPATLKGNRLSVKVRCPRKVGRTCKIGVQGMLKKRKPATATRRLKVRKGKVKKVVLKVKPKAMKKVAARKKLLFKETVSAGKAHATVYKRLKLVRR